MDITSRGIRYVELAINTLYDRERKLINAWCSDHEFIGVVTTERQRRLMTIANELKRRYDLLLRYRYDYLEKQKEEKIRSDHERVMIECHNFMCRKETSTGLVMYRKDYVPGEHKCTNCGCEMMTYDEWQVARRIVNGRMY